MSCICLQAVQVLTNKQYNFFKSWNILCWLKNWSPLWSLFIIILKYISKYLIPIDIPSQKILLLVWKKNHFERSVYLEWKEWKVHNIFTDLIMEGSQIVKNTSITYFHSLLPWVNKVHNCDAWALLCDVVLSRLAFVWVQTTRSAKNDYFSNLKFSLSAIEVYFQ